jgi:hypothetical protein
LEPVTLRGRPIDLNTVVAVSTLTSLADPTNPKKGSVSSLTVTYSCGDPKCQILHKDNAGGESF